MPDTLSQPPGRLRLLVRLDLPNGGRIGPGKIRLIEAIAETGSISAAGRALGMSYRRAWLLLDALNRSFVTPVVTASVGGRDGGGAALTPFGRELVATYRAFEAETLQRAADRFAGPLASLAPPIADPETDAT